MCPPIRDTSTSAPRTTPKEIRVEGLHRSFGEHEVLRGVDLEILRGELVAIVGGSGCGKSVLMEHMVGLLTPTLGRVLVANHAERGAPLRDLAELDEDEMDRLRRHWAIVFQRNALYSTTVRENIEFWLREHTTLDEPARLERIRGALNSVGFERENGIEEKRRDELSGGMAKRVAIARAIAMDPAIVFYDEPTTGLDPDLATQIQDLVAKVHHSPRESDGVRTTIVITHDKDLLRRLEPRIVMLHDGGVLFDGEYRAFERSRSPVIRPYFELMPALQLRPVAQ